MRIFNRLADRFAAVRPLTPGTFQRRSIAAEGAPYRVHLRLGEDGSGLLILNASTVLQLNPSAAEWAFHFVQGTPPDRAAAEVAARYRISKRVAREEYEDFVEKIESLLGSPDLDPSMVLQLDRAVPHSAVLTAPLRLDCALTYRLRPGVTPDAAVTSRVTRELTTDEWGVVLDKAWRAGIPHVTFTGGEATLREDLADLISRAEQNGQVCGLVTDGIRLSDRPYLETLLQTGLDHVLLVLRPEDPLSWNALGALVEADVFLTAHLTLGPETVGGGRGFLERMAKVGVKNLSLSASDPRLTNTMVDLRSVASEQGLLLRWDLPVPFSELNPIAAETAEENVPAGAGTAWLYVEPDGDVLRSPRNTRDRLGNLLTDDWNSLKY